MEDTEISSFQTAPPESTGSLFPSASLQPAKNAEEISMAASRRRVEKPPGEQEIQAAVSALAGARLWNGIGDVPAKRLIQGLLSLANIRRRQRDLVRAESLLKEASHLLVEHPNIDAILASNLHEALGSFHEDAGRDAEALQHLQTALEYLGSGSAPQPVDLGRVHLAISECCERLGDRVHADQFLRSAQQYGSHMSEEKHRQSKSAPKPLIESFLLRNHAGEENLWKISWHRN